jgi:hypothetical protein
MSALPLRTPCLCVRISPPTLSIGGLPAAGSKLPLHVSPFSATFRRPVKFKSFICNGYKIHGGVGRYVSRRARHSRCVTSVTHSNVRKSNRFMRLLHGSLDTRGGGVCPSPSGSSALPSPLNFGPQRSTFNFQLSTLSTSHQSRFTSHRTRVTDHGSRITPP